MFEAWNMSKGRKVQGGRILSQGTVCHSLWFLSQASLFLVLFHVCVLLVSCFLLCFVYLLKHSLPELASWLSVHIFTEWQREASGSVFSFSFVSVGMTSGPGTAKGSHASAGSPASHASAGSPGSHASAGSHGPRESNKLTRFYIHEKKLLYIEGMNAFDFDGMHMRSYTERGNSHPTSQCRHLQARSAISFYYWKIRFSLSSYCTT